MIQYEEGRMSVPEFLHDIFISYTEADSDTVSELAKGLEKAGYHTWYYERDSLPGPAYLKQVIENINSSKILLVIISVDSLLSTQVYNEITYAHENQKPFMPVLKNITHAEFQQRKPDWRMILGAYTTIRIPNSGVDQILDKIIQGTKALLRQDSTCKNSKYDQTTPSSNNIIESYGKSGKGVFISHSRKDLDFVRNLQVFLSNQGYSIWTDELSGVNTDIYQPVTQSAIQTSDFFIFIISPDNVLPDSMGRKELEYAINLKIPVIPIKLEKNIQFSFPIAQCNTIDATDHRQMEKMLLTTLHEMSSGKELTEPAKSGTTGELFEPIARILYEEYLKEMKTQGHKINDTKEWDLLGEDSKTPYREQALVFINDLKKCGYIIREDGTQSVTPITFSPEEIEILSRLEHNHWVEDKIKNGWTYGQYRDNSRKIHNCIVKWEELSENERQKDRTIVSRMPILLAIHGYKIVKEMVKIQNDIKSTENYGGSLANLIHKEYTNNVKW